jgi:hypothetical protein
LRTHGADLRSFRLHLLGASLAFALLFSLIAAAVLFARWVVPLELGAQGPEQAVEAIDRILVLHATLWPVVALSLLGVALAATWLFARMSGPLVRFVAAFDALRGGDVPRPLEIRASDYLVREAAALNAMLEVLRARGATFAVGRGELLEDLEALSMQLAQGSDRASADLAARALERAKALDAPVPTPKRA